MQPDLEEKIHLAAARLIGHGATAVYVLGSALTGSFRDDSDIDFAVEGLPPRVFFRAMAEASRVVGRDVDLVSLDRPDRMIEGLRRSGDLKRVA